MLGIVPSLHHTQYTVNTCDVDALSHTRHTKLSIEGTFMSIFVCAGCTGYLWEHPAQLVQSIGLLLQVSLPL